MKTVSKEGKGIYTEKKSEFIAFAKRADSFEEIKSFIEKLKKEYKDARHICYACKTPDGIRQYDDKEPQKTAGAPIMKIIEAKELENVVVAVVRYFGGIKLGAANLSAAYAKAAASAVENAEICTLTLCKISELTLSLKDGAAFKKALLKGRGKILKEVYNSSAIFTVAEKDGDSTISDMLKNFNVAVTDCGREWINF